MSSVGSTLTRAVTLPIAAVGVASVAMAVDFDKSMTKIRALVGASDSQMKTYRETVLSLSKQTGRGPKELAEALYFVTSSGFEGASALRVLEASAKASAAGLGDTATIADAVTSAVNAYGEKALSASKATDILLAAVREGKNEPEELAGAIGRVIPVAEAMGVSFGEVAGTMAALSLNGTDANEAVTQIVAGMSQSIKPTKQGAEALAKLDMTYGDLRKSIKDKGLIDTFNDLKTAFGGNVEEVAKVFGNIRALRGVLTLTGPAAEKYKDIIEAVGKAQGDTNRAFGVAAQSPAQKFAVAMAKLKVAAIEMGTALTPIALTVAGAISSMAEAFNSLGSGGQKAVLALAGIVALAGPLMRVAGAVSQIASGLKIAGGSKVAGGLGKLAMGALGSSAGAAVVPVALVAVAAGATIALSKSLNAQEGMIRRGIDPATGAPINVGTRRWGRGGNNDPSFGAAEAVRAASNKQVFAKLTIQAQNKTGPAFMQVMQDYQTVKELTEAGIELKIDPEKPLASLQSIQARIMATGQTSEQALKTMERVYGKDVVAPLRRHLQAVVPTMEGVKRQVTAKHAQMAAALMKKIRMPAPDAGGMLGVLDSIIARMQALGYSASQAADAVARAVSAAGHLKSGVGAGGSVPVDTGSATGGLTTGPMSGYRALLHGTELIVPLNGMPFTPNRVVDYGRGSSSGSAPIINLNGPFIGAPPDSWGEFVQAHAEVIVNMGLAEYSAGGAMSARNAYRGY